MTTTITSPRVSVRYPGPKADDARIAVTIEDPASAWPITFYFVRITDDDAKATVDVNVGFEIGQRFDMHPDDATIELERLPRPLDPLAVQAVLDGFREYVEYARSQALHLERKALPGKGSSAAKRRRRKLDDPFLSLVVEQYRAWNQRGGRAMAEIARAHGVDRSQALRWIEKARERGLLEPKGGGTDGE